MKQVLWLSQADVFQTGICSIASAVPVVERAFKLFEDKKAVIAQEVGLRWNPDGSDQACYALPAWVGGEFEVSGLKWSAHGPASNLERGVSRIHASIILNDPVTGEPFVMMNGTDIGAVRTGAVTAVALKKLAPKQARKAALCGAGAQAERQLQALFYAMPGLQEIAVWSRSGVKNVLLADRYAGQSRILIRPAASLEDAADGADILIGATSAPSPYIVEAVLKSVSLYCHIGFHEISFEALSLFKNVYVDTWDDAKNVSGQSLFRMYRQGLFPQERLSGCLGALVAGKLRASRAVPSEKTMFDAFGLPIFDVSLAKEAFSRAKAAGLGQLMDW